MFKLFCSEKNNKRIKKYFEEKEIQVDDKGEFVIMESNSNEKIDSVLGKLEDKYSLLSFVNIHYFEANGQDVFCYTADKQYKVRERLYILQDITINKGFLRVSKSHVINVKKIKSIIPMFNSKFILEMENGNEVDVTRTYIQDFKDYIQF